MNQSPNGSAPLPPPPARIFLAGIGGIGMSALAQFLRWQGYEVGGSDRELSGPGRDELYAKLRRQGIRLWPQDGSGVREFKPALIVHSTAVEEGNPDFAAAAALGIPRQHRAAALAAALDRLPGRQIGVAGSCGKTSVTAWIAAALRDLGRSVAVIGGGYAHDCVDDTHPGNFFADSTTPEFLVCEVDESDGSLTAFRPHVGVVLNLGTDHFDRTRLCELFTTYLGRSREAMVVEHGLTAELTLPPSLPATAFAAGPLAVSQPLREGRDTPSPERGQDAPSPKEAGRPLSQKTPVLLCLAPENYEAGLDGIAFDLAGAGRCRVRQYGRHSATNAAAVLAVLRAAGVTAPPEALRRALAAFRGVARRFDRIGVTPAGAVVFDDYAHNIEKICAALAAAQELTPGPVLAVFQPHGFGPFKFMRTPLLPALRAQLRPGDRFALLPVYYAGGSTDFKPSAAEVAAELRAAGLPVLDFPDRDAAAAFLRGPDAAARAVLVLGARDPGLPAWCAALAEVLRKEKTLAAEKQLFH